MWRFSIFSNFMGFFDWHTYFLTWISDIRKWGRLKNLFFYFCSPTISSKLYFFTKQSNRWHLLSAQEKKAVILTGFLTVNIHFFEVDIKYIKAGPKKNFFFNFFCSTVSQHGTVILKTFQHTDDDVKWSEWNFGEISKKTENMSLF